MNLQAVFLKFGYFNAEAFQYAVAIRTSAYDKADENIRFMQK